MVRIRAPFSRPDKNVAVADNHGNRADQPKRSAEDSGSDSSSKKRLRMTGDENDRANSSALAPLDGTTPTTTSGTLPSSGPSTPPNHPHSPNPSPAPSPSTNVTKPISKDRNKIAKRRRAVPVKGTKADRLREYLKYFPKRHFPASSSSRSQSCSSNSRPGNRSITVELSPEVEDNLDDD